ncbi:hypothetical protein ACFQH3_17970 [Haladaptatus sp. GCM10025707]
MPEGTDLAAAQEGTREALFEEETAASSVPVYDGERIPVNASVEGPAIIEEPTTTIVVNPAWTARLDESGVYELTKAD